MITSTIPIKTISVSNAHEVWQARSRRSKKERAAAFLFTRKHPLPCKIVLTRISPGLLDDDNIRGALKSIRDGIADRFGLDDRDPRIRWEYAQERGKKGEYLVRVQMSHWDDFSGP